MTCPPEAPEAPGHHGDRDGDRDDHRRDGRDGHRRHNCQLPVLSPITAMLDHQVNSVNCPTVERNGWEGWRVGGLWGWALDCLVLNTRLE